MADKQVKTEQRGRVLWVTLDNPPRNFMNAGMVAELDTLVSWLEDDESVGSVVFTGALDDVFITHYDVEEILAATEASPTLSPRQASAAIRAVEGLGRVPGADALLEKSPARGAVALRDIHELFLRMNRLDKVLIAAINGLAMGGGCELVLACDIRFMADGDYRIGLPESTLGIIPGAGGTQRMTRALGPGRALELMLEGRGLTPREALSVGLVHHVSQPDALLEEAGASAERLARRSPATVAAIKRAVYEGGSDTFERGSQLERAGFLAVAGTSAARKAMRQYVAETAERGEVTVAEAIEILERWRRGEPVDLARVD